MYFKFQIQPKYKNTNECGNIDRNKNINLYTNSLKWRNNVLKDTRKLLNWKRLSGIMRDGGEKIFKKSY